MIFSLIERRYEWNILNFFQKNEEEQGEKPRWKYVKDIMHTTLFWCPCEFKVNYIITDMMLLLRVNFIVFAFFRLYLIHFY